MQKLKHCWFPGRPRYSCRFFWAEAETLTQAQELFSPPPVRADTCVSLIKQCSSLHSLKTVYASMLRSHFHLNLYFLTNLIAQYVSLGSISHAYSLFSSSHSSDPFLWNVMIRGFVDHAQYHRSVLLYIQMLELGIRPNNYTFPFVIKACGCLRNVEFGIQVHDDVVEFGYESDVFVCNSLIVMYGKCERYELSRQVFDRMPDRNETSWSTIIRACSLNDHYEEGLSLFWRMLREDIRPDRATVLNVMACAYRVNDADEICRVAVFNGFDFDQYVHNAALGMYARCGRIDLARSIFDGILNKDIVTWASMIEAYAQADLPLEALGLFKQMNSQRIFPDSVTLLSVVRACSVLASFRHAHAVHGIIILTGGFFNNPLAVETAVIDLYTKCGSLTYARKVFDRMQSRNIITWSAMISGYGMHGLGGEAYNLFNQMKSSVKPDHIAFVSILSACSHSGLVAEGWECFNSMARDFRVTPRTEHYACMVDLLGRAGKLDEAQVFIERMPIGPDAGVWGALLGACRVHSNIDLAEMAAKALLDLDSKNPGRYVLLSNIYASSGKTKDAHKIRTLMMNRGVRKVSGHTIIEIKNKVYTFVAGDRSHPQTDLIYSELERVMDRIRQEGYTPDMNFVLHDVEEETKEKMLYVHSEKLAIVFGLLNSRSESVIRIRKNLRICGDCHTATKFISKVTRREIVVRDARRFHHFKDGTCSCGDYW
ncbi:hypothetical protein P3X46_001052 [Hevea brasiliensis]|uniref:DYW domain-containing protein n=1 Tax=Hevea brasiliensis TaxID=3981 RepID=A0ABQ9NBC2_HEVBR|nr:pentatricopeptide repeat-containing protein At3g26782, mitochondrial [Hevea brasiliensis]XP_021646615.2 pentatricopeptide repeat-containing protein At3g26782, mitochondrial [Hevea brasiliensis]XP_058003676.1 pentatricopeptide repeat-containing protein At3g26782, mitochondrial [Hevea brasiliensis]XP_058003687.1 pentatricopeptide repeat-containing protein At3g26782, mitochondrial [Hevea brasiliensis]KAJ9189799.1 hypothetical protein P3X46_001052 [Hevea brasiliensis]